MWLIPTQEDSTPEERWLWFMEHFTPDMEKVLYVEAFRILKSKQDAEDDYKKQSFAVRHAAGSCAMKRNCSNGCSPSSVISLLINIKTVWSP